MIIKFNAYNLLIYSKKLISEIDCLYICILINLFKI